MISDLKVENKTAHISFVVLHYMGTSTTKECIESIIQTMQKADYGNYSIIIVDNASPNHSGKELQDYYKEKQQVVVILEKENRGFAYGNNIGYRYAQVQKKADYIICTNNDTIFRQSALPEKIQQIYKEKKCALIAPDIVTPEEIHQNPRRKRMLTKKEAYKSCLIKIIFLRYYQLKKMLHLEGKFMFLERMYQKKDLKNFKAKEYTKSTDNIVPVGACIIYTPAFVQKERYAFSPKTFMYGEEDLLSYYCYKKKYLISYIPELQVLHMSGMSTKQSYANSLEKEIFTYKYIILGLKLYIKSIRDEQ